MPSGLLELPALPTGSSSGAGPPAKIDAISNIRERMLECNVAPYLIDVVVDRLRIVTKRAKITRNKIL